MGYACSNYSPGPSASRLCFNLPVFSQGSLRGLWLGQWKVKDGLPFCLELNCLKISQCW